MILQQREDSFRATFAGGPGLLPRIEVFHYDRQKCVAIGMACYRKAQRKFPEDFLPDQPAAGQTVKDAVLAMAGVIVFLSQLTTAAGVIVG